MGVPNLFEHDRVLWGGGKGGFGFARRARVYSTCVQNMMGYLFKLGIFSWSWGAWRALGYYLGLMSAAASGSGSDVPRTPFLITPKGVLCFAFCDGVHTCVQT